MERSKRRTLVAKEAAKLLYYNMADEYKQAKENASAILGTKSLPSNSEVALELDRIADEAEGISRKDLIVRLRREALTVMTDLKPFNPRLVGSVWRGTAKRGSDIDITAYSPSPEPILNVIKNKYTVQRVEQSSKTDEGETMRFIHVYINLPSDDEVEIVVRSPEHMREKYKCDIYGDTVTGLTLSQLRKVLDADPLQKFIPKK